MDRCSHELPSGKAQDIAGRWNLFDLFLVLNATVEILIPVPWINLGSMHGKTLPERLTLMVVISSLVVMAIEPHSNDII